MGEWVLYLRHGFKTQQLELLSYSALKMRTALSKTQHFTEDTHKHTSTIHRKYYAYLKRLQIFYNNRDVTSKLRRWKGNLKQMPCRGPVQNIVPTATWRQKFGSPSSSRETY